MIGERHFLIRVTRYGPLVPARIWWCDSEPGEPDNKLDRGRLSIYLRAEIGGVEVPPEQLTERLYSATDWRPAIAPTHWRFPREISEPEYRFRTDSIRWASAHRPADPRLRPRSKVTGRDVPVPDFTRENSL